MDTKKSMKMDYQLDSIDKYNKSLGIETLHPLVTVCNLKDVQEGASNEWLEPVTDEQYGALK